MSPSVNPPDQEQEGKTSSRESSASNHNESSALLPDRRDVTTAADAENREKTGSEQGSERR